MSYRLVSRIPQIIAQTERQIAAANARTAKSVAKDASAMAPKGATGRLAASIAASEAGDDAWKVEVEAWYAHFVEFGTVYVAARPFMTPAVELHRDEHQMAIRDAYKTEQAALRKEAIRGVLR